MSAPKVSVVVTAFNSEKYLAEALQSVAEQSFEYWELIVVDDGSDDDSARRICEAFENEYRNTIKYIFKQNGGPSSARNAGLSEASGDYVAFLDADDCFMREKLTIQVELLDQLVPAYGFIIGCSEKFKGGKRDGIVACPDEVDGYMDVESFIWGNTGIRGTPGFLFWRQALLSVNGFDETLRNNEDLDLFLRLGQRYKLKSHNDVVFRHRLRPDSLSKGDPIAGLHGALLFSKKIATMFPEASEKAIGRKKQRAYFSAAMKCLKKSEIRHFLWLTKKGLKFSRVTTWRGRTIAIIVFLFGWLATKPNGIDQHSGGWG